MLVANIRGLCGKQGISVAKLERTLDFGNGTISCWDKKLPSVLRVKAVADYFGVTMESLLSDSGKDSEARHSQQKVSRKGEISHTESR